ncbi:LAME_0F03906g1_1 [Lachancea meyersii CBS 8951]|uniref:LAME_0F03906g1_1 n=1 Tax=Lachancea meyersii CBS 8951 TaxID=1266667 RepID=A0A1G4JS11_9SACH|nr:LAME_0F03906g1_1 [Lachancea meyersii CBS 8951]
MSQYAPNSSQRSKEQQDYLSCQPAAATDTMSLNQRNSILDPHLSVLHLLERAEQHAPTSQSEIAPFKRPEFIRSPSPPKTCASEVMNRSISDSWQSIKRTDYSILNVLNDPATHHHHHQQQQQNQHQHQQQPVGILSSSDTSEDEPDHFLSPSPNHYSFSGNVNTIFSEPPHALETPALGAYRDPSFQIARTGNQSFSADGAVNDNDNDNETVTLSLMNSSHSFVMPKLSVVKPSQKFCILIVGKPAQRFYRDIPKSYRKLFDVCDAESLDSRRINQYSAVMIIFTEPKHEPPLLEKVASQNNNIIAVCQRGQQQQISGLLGRFSSSHELRLIYHLTVISDHQDVHRLLRYLHSLSSEVDSGYETEAGSRKIRKRRKSQKKRPNNGSLNRWVMWSISLTVGVGIGYCLSCVLSSAVSIRSGALAIASANDGTGLDEVPVSSQEHTLDNYIRQLVLAFKKAVKQVNLSCKQYLNGQSLLVLWMQRMGKEWMSEDSDSTLPGVAALDLVLV